MPPKPKYNKEDIVNAALAIAAEKGFAAVTVTSVAQRLNCSVAPIYVNFASADEMVATVMEKVMALSAELLAQQKGDNVFENIGKASLAFAGKYPVLFRELAMKPNPYMSSYDAMEDNLIGILAADEAMKNWTDQERRRLLFKMRVFQTGLAVMVANGQVPKWLDNDALEQMLIETGDDVLLAQQTRKGKDFL